MTRCHGSCATLLITVTALTHGLFRLGFLRLASRLTNLFNVRVTTHVYPRRALWPSSQYHYPSCILPFPRRPHRPTRCGYGSALWFLSFLISCMAFRLEDTIPALIRPPLVPLEFCLLLLLLLFVFFAAIINTLGHRLLYRQTNLGGWTTSFAASPCCWRICVVSSIISSCIGLYVFPAIGWSTCSTWVNLFVDGSIGLSLMIASISVTNQNWSRAVYLNHYSSCHPPL